MARICLVLSLYQLQNSLESFIYAQAVNAYQSRIKDVSSWITGKLCSFIIKNLSTVKLNIQKYLADYSLWPVCRSKLGSLLVGEFLMQATLTSLDVFLTVKQHFLSYRVNWPGFSN